MTNNNSLARITRPDLSPVLNEVAEAELRTREASFNVLSRLEAKGVTQAAIVAKALADIDPEVQPLAASLADVAANYDTKLATIHDPIERRAVKTLRAVARISFGIAATEAVAPTAPARATELLRVARTAMGNEAEHGVLSSEIGGAFSGMLDDVQLTIPLPPIV